MGPSRRRARPPPRRLPPHRCAAESRQDSYHGTCASHLTVVSVQLLEVPVLPVVDHPSAGTARAGWESDAVCLN